MQDRELIDFMDVCEKLKCNTRHSWTSSGREESVAEHSWRVAVLAMLLLMEEEFKNVDFQKLVSMCLLHDIGEAVTGDIPSFLKTEADSQREDEVVDKLIEELPSLQKEKIQSLFQEMHQMKSVEARLYKALDKLEAVIQHNEAPLSTWLPLEHELNQTYGYAESGVHPRIRQLRDTCVADTVKKLRDSSQ